MIASLDTIQFPLTIADRVYGAVAPGVFELVRAAARVLGTPAHELHSRVGVMPEVAPPVVWLHGASSGEMSAALRLISLLRRHGLHFRAAYTTTNQAGLDFVVRTAESGTTAVLAPWYHPTWVARDRALATGPVRVDQRRGFRKQTRRQWRLARASVHDPAARADARRLLADTARHWKRIVRSLTPSLR